MGQARRKKESQCQGKSIGSICKSNILAVATGVAVTLTFFYNTHVFHQWVIIREGSSYDEPESKGKIGTDITPFIDVVFTYVNNSDPVWQNETKSKGLSSPNSSRYRDFGQIRYAMRSVFMHATPYVRNFILVVSNKHTQIPSWLNATHPRIRVVEHKEIWDNPEYLPSMNSHAIEWALPNIPDLSPKFLYLNDDFAIYKKLDLPMIMPSKDHFVLWEAWGAPTSPHQVNDEYGKSLAYVTQWYNKKYGTLKNRKVASHVPLLLDVAVMKTIKGDFPEKFETMYRMGQLRTNTDVQTQFAFQQYIRHHRPHLRAPENHVHFLGLNLDKQDQHSLDKKVLDRIRTDPRQFICIQDGFPRDQIITEKVIDQIHNFYEELFPTRCPWEIIA